jgi:hypothetical protein
MRPRFLLFASAVALAAAACTGGASPGSSSREGETAVPAETLLLGTEAGPLAVRAPAGSVIFDGAGAVATPDGSLAISTSSSGGSTTLTTRDAATAEIRARTTVPEDLSVRVVSADGSAAALMPPLPEGWDPWVPIPRSRTSIVVADPSGSRDPRTYDLRGNFEPEAFSTDGSRLFLIQFLPAEAPAVYRVTELDLARGKVRPVFGPYKGPAERMPGTRLAQVHAPDGTKLYTLYTSERPGYAPHDAPVAANAVVSFVHVLSLDDGWAHCVGLPKAFWHRPAGAEAIAASPDGSSLYIVDSGLGIVTRMDTDTLDTFGTRRIGLRIPGADRTTAQVSADGRTLFVAAGRTVIEIDTASFEVVRRISATGDVTGLGLSGDGARLYLGLVDGLEVLDAATGSELGLVPVTTPAPIVNVSALVG